MPLLAQHTLRTDPFNRPLLTASITKGFAHSHPRLSPVHMFVDGCILSVCTQYCVPLGLAGGTKLNHHEEAAQSKEVPCMR
jgi:hypothetical protein